MVQIVLATIALVGIATTVLSLVWLHFRPTGLNPVSAAVSQYGISASRGGYRVATIALGVAAISLGAELTIVLDHPSVSGLIFLLLFGVARLVIGWAPMDDPGAVRTGTGRMHNVLATVFFASATTAAFLYSGAFAQDGSIASIAAVSIALAWAMAAISALILTSVFLDGLKRFFGLIERVLYIAIIDWMTIVTVAVLTE